ncbi:D-alanyl-D-alanine carboxypeptidase [Streptomyces erythrochromogenes]|uniref:D-alanyl-D-alanine carboxypeptidase n=1 Tax=Streptomyces erythrochromogenes TaxID=285574 RepID=UPI00382FF97D
MAGESPDKSVDEETPGAAKSSAERDPRLSVFRPRESEDGADVARAGESGAEAEAEAEAGGRDALREAVAAWVATTAEEPAAADADSASASGSAPAAEAKPAVAAEPADSGRTAVFRAVKPGSAGGAASGSGAAKPGSADGDKPSAEAASPSAPADGSADRRTEKPGSADEDEPSAEGGSASGGAKPSAPADEAGGSGRTAVFRAVKPGSDGGAASGSADEGKRSAESESESGSASDQQKPATAEPSKPSAPADGPADRERTAVFRAVKPGSADEDKPSAEAEGQPAGEQKPAAAQPSAPADGSADSERTAVFRAVKPGAAGATGGDKQSAAKPEAAKASAPADGSADSERTAVFRAVKPGAGATASGGAGKPSAEAGSGSGSGSGEAKPEAAKASAPAAGAADSERTAVFRVPKVDALKSDAGQKSKPAAAKPNSASPSGSAPADDSERTAVFRAPKPEAPKASTFVPLRTDGDGTTEAKPKPTPTPTRKPPVPPTPSVSAAASTTTERLDHSDRSERTTQQPLPPKPPLDMLADLTNNPPPPPSPLRTAVRRFKIYAPLVVLLGIILAIVQLVRPLPEPTLVMTAKSSYTFEGAMPQLPWPSEGQAYMAAAGLGTLGQSGEQKPVPIASVTKSMTAYIILRDHPIKKGEQGAMIDVDKTAETEGKKNDSVNNESTLDTVKEGDKISEYDAIAALMIPSANNIARLLARWDSGSQEAFVKKMNDTAKELGMTNTTYTDPSGLDATTVSTAEDQVKLGLKLVEIETLLDITKKPNWVDPSGKSWRNWNGLTGPSGALGIKTGTTTKAGGNLLFAAQKKIGNTNQLIVGAVLGQHKPSIIDTVLAASKQLMTATQKALDGATVVKKGDVVGYVDDGLGGRTPVVATADVQAIGWASLTVTVKLADGGGAVPQTATAGTEVGMLTVGEGASQVKVPVALKSDLASPGIGSKLTRIG